MKKQKVLSGRIEAFVFRLVPISNTDTARIKSNEFTLLPMSPIGDKAEQFDFDSSHSIVYDAFGKYVKITAGQKCRLLKLGERGVIEQGETLKLNYILTPFGHSVYADFFIERI